MNKVKVEIKISDQQIEDIMSSAAVGLRYWVDHYNVNYTRHQEYKSGLKFENALTNNAFVRVYDSIAMKSYALTKKKLLAGIARAILDNKFDLNRYDSADADVAVQYGLFGKVIYG